MNLQDLKISTRLGLGFSVLILLVVSMAGFGLVKVKDTNHSTQTLYEDRVVPLKQLKVVSDMYNINILNATNKVAAGLLAPRAALTDMDTANDKIRAQWSAYKATYLIEDEKRAAAQAEDQMAKLQTVLPALRTALESADREKIAAMLPVLYASIPPLIETLDRLAEIQIEEGKAEYARATQTYNSTVMLFGLIVLLAVAAGVIIGWRLIRAIATPIDQAVALAKAIAEGDLTQQTHYSGNNETAVLLGALDTMQASLVRLVSSVRQGSEGVLTASAEIASGNNDLSARTESQASALQETASSMEQLSSTVKQNADTARQANQLALNASAVAVKGGSVVSQVVDTMKGINDASRKIADIISVIDGIAFQTNILALNAAVEAARAGEQGRGFAVVASEVRSLAGRSAEAAREIKILINASVERVEQGAILVDEAGTTMTEVVGSIKRVTDLMGEISAASNEQAAGVAQVGEAVTQMDQSTQQNAALVEQMAAAASSLKSQAQELVQTVATFKLANTPVALAASRGNIRSVASKAGSFQGQERRVNAKPAGTPAKKSPPTLTHKPAASSDDSWETF
ncbi:MAG: MCP four helix bundle domain-containing protein [Rhodoferax sp.]|nr:MCP four helix bundle domain-containing protein [Rhodoferax sp.]